MPQMCRSGHAFAQILRHHVFVPFQSTSNRTNRYLLCFQWSMCFENGAPGRNRTRDLRFTKPLLYQLSYKGNAAPVAIYGAEVKTKIRAPAGRNAAHHENADDNAVSKVLDFLPGTAGLVPAEGCG